MDMNQPAILGIPVFVDDQTPPNRIALIDAAGILKRCPRDSQGRIIVTPAICEGRVVYLSLDLPVSDTEGAL